MNNILIIVLLAVTMLVIDGLWIGTIRGDFYKQEIKRIQGQKMSVRLPGAVMAYVLMIVAIVSLSIPLTQSKLNSKSNGEIWSKSFLYGGLLGLCVYGVYNGTNYATLKRYSMEYVVTDTLWGMFIMGLITGLGVWLMERN